MKKITNKNMGILKDLREFYNSYSLTKTGNFRKRRDFCVMVPLEPIKIAMKLPCVEKALKTIIEKPTRDTNKILVEGLQQRFNYAIEEQNKEDGQLTFLLHMEQLDILMETIAEIGV